MTAPTNWSMQVLSTLTSDTDPCIVFSFAQSPDGRPGSGKYIFNVGENTNRAFIQSKANWSGTRGIFLTGVGRGVNRDRTGGLAGMLMTFADAFNPSEKEKSHPVAVVGPPGTKHLLASMRGYMYRESLPVLPKQVPFDVQETAPSPVFKDSLFTVYAIPIRPSPSSSQLLKRKRQDDTETEPPSKKIAAAAHTDPDAPMSSASLDSELPIEQNLASLLSSPSFGPSTLNTLSSAQSQEWRELMVDIMFPASRAARAEQAEREAALANSSGDRRGRFKHDKKKNKGKGKQDASASTASTKGYERTSRFVLPKDKSGEPDDYRRPSLVDGFHAQLPRFKAADGVRPSALAVSYLCVGPLVRGKFDGAKADKLGIPNRLRGKLSKGETVTFKGKGEEEVEVKPEDVIAPSVPPAAALILDIPSPEYIPSLVQAFSEGGPYARWCKYGSSSGSVPVEDIKEAEDFTLHTIIHLLGEDVLEDERYQAFMAGFEREEKVHHIISSPPHLPDPVTFTSSAYQQLKLAQLDPEVFRMPKFRTSCEKDLFGIPNLPKSVTAMKHNMLVSMRPMGPPVQDEGALAMGASDEDAGVGEAGTVVASMNTSTVMTTTANPDVTTSTNTDTDITTTTTTNIPDATPSTIQLKPHTAAAFTAGRAAAEAYAASPAGMRKLSSMITGEGGAVIPSEKPKGHDVSVITLGTGSAVPGKYRNVSATVVRIPGYGSVLLDCGEGTWGQLCRMFGGGGGGKDGGVEDVYCFLRELRCLFVSHVHGDHHMGLAKLLAMRKSLNPPPTHPLYLVTLRSVHVYLRELSDLEDLGLFDDDGAGIVTVLSPALHWKQSNDYVATGMWSVGGTEEWLDLATSRRHAAKMCESLNLKSLHTVDMRHRTRCYGCVIRSLDGWSISFSADSMPSDALVYASNSSNNHTTLLIHEATMSDDEVDLAARKAHSTMGQALEVGKRMRAANPVDDSPFIILAFDHAYMTLGTMWKMQFYLEAIERGLEEVGDGVEEEEDRLRRI
ncbi:hypothetical protein BDP27DRAFT_1407846 [Rhodocollybia butyracea]|uniref:ribonuclease Z n=1 Tax=Rhodocollybia butyracea TaxID=206335 RepID=A0A9P5TY87_9AGAR|nr:hypothetical protein BDP27DRAFT_1407846 [Rhodocollybia butyracea]